LRYLLALLLLAGCFSSKRTLHLYVWSDFVSPEAIQSFEKKYDCRVIIDTFDSNESMVAKLLAGGGGYDIIFPTQYFVTILENQDLIIPLNLEEIPNTKNIDVELLEQFHIPEFKSALPYMLTTTGIGYRIDRVEKPTSWTVFGNKNYKGRMILLNDIRDVLGSALLTLGYSVNSTNKTEINKAADLVLEWRKNLAKFDSDYKNGIASSEFLICQAYSGEIQQVINETPEVGYVIPNEGSIVSADMVAIPRSAGDVELAYAFLDHLLDPNIARINMEFAYGNPANKVMFSTLPEGLKENQLIFPPEHEIKRCFPILDVGNATVYYNEAWNRIKSH